MTESSPAAEARLEALEAANAHHERTIAELSDAIAAQWSRIDALTREVLRLREELQGLSQAVAVEKPPPHY